MKTFRAEFLNSGQPFIIPSCTETLRNLKCIRANQDSVYCSGKEWKNQKWNDECFYIAPSTPVVIQESDEKTVDKKEKLVENEKVEQKYIMNTTEQPANAVKTSRRKSKDLTVDYPDGEFTKSDLAARNPHLSASELTSVVSKLTVVGKAESTGKRGRRKIIYKLR